MKIIKGGKLSPLDRLCGFLGKMRYGELRAITLALFQKGCCSRCAAIATGLVDEDTDEQQIDYCLRRALNEGEEIAKRPKEHGKEPANG